MPGRSSFGQTLAVAAVVHAALFAIAGSVRTSPRHVAQQAATLDVIEVEVPTTVPEPSEVAPGPTEPRSEPAVADNLPRAITRRPVAAAPAGSAITLPESAPEAPGGWTLPVGTARPAAASSATALVTLGLAGPNQFMGHRETPEEEARAAHEQANRAAGEAMRAAMHDHDVEIGLGGGGPVVTALEAAVRDGIAPDEGRAEFVAIADASGNVLRVDIESSTDDAGFRAVADDLLRRLQGQHLRVPSGAHGLAMRVHVDSHMATPSGGSAGLDARNAGGHFDIADLGARPRRVIHARVLAEQVL